MHVPTQNVDSSPRQRWIFLMVVSMGLFLIALDNSILFTALPVLREQLHATELGGLWVINIYPLMMVGLLLGTGTLGDKIGHRLLFIIGLVIFGITSLIAAFSPTVWWLVAARAALGFGAASMLPATLALIRITFIHEREFATAIGIWGAVALVGASAGPIVGGILLHYFWWGSVFLINVPIVIIAIIATIVLAPPNIPHPEKHWDALSSFYALIALGSLVMIIKEIAAPEHHWWVLYLTIPGALIGSFLFSRRQKLLAEPLLSFDIFRNRFFSGGVIAAALSMMGVSGVELLTTQRFQLVAEYTPLQAGILMSAFALMALPASIAGGMWLHRFGFLAIIGGGFLISGTGVGVAVWGAIHDHLGLFIIALAISGVGAGLVWSVASTAIISAAPAHRTGMAAAVENVSYEFGTLIAVAVAGSLQTFFYARAVPAGVPLEPTRGTLHPDPAIRALADAAFDEGYLKVLLVVCLFAAMGVISALICFRGNPKSIADILHASATKKSPRVAIEALHKPTTPTTPTSTKTPSTSSNPSTPSNPNTQTTPTNPNPEPSPHASE